MAQATNSMDRTEEAWSKIASDYESNIGRVSTVVARRLIELANSARRIDGTSNVLDVGAGTGAVALAIASDYPQCKVLATDISSRMLSVIDGHDPANVSTEVIKAEQLEDLDSQFSHAFSAFMLQVTKTPMKVLEGMRDQLDDNGVMALAIWGIPCDPFKIWEDACKSINPSFSNGAEFDDPYAWRTKPELKTHMESAGLKNLVIEDIEVPFEFPSTGAFVDFWFNGKNPGAVNVIDKWKGDFELAKLAVERICREQYRDGKGIQMQAVMGVGRK